MRLFGQDEYDYAAEVGYETPYYEESYSDIYAFDYDPGTGSTETIPAFDYPSESRYVTNWQEQQEAIQSQAASGAGFFDIFKSILGLATPIITSAIRTGQGTAILPATTGKASVGASSITSAIKSITSNPLLLIGLGVGGFLLLRGRGKK